MKSKTIVLAVLCGSPVFAGAIELTDFTDPNTAFGETYVDFNAKPNVITTNDEIATSANHSLRYRVK